MQQLSGVIRHYPWGSRTMLADLRGVDAPADRPEAELWYGAHPAAPATIDGRPLTDIIAADPAAALGDRVRSTHGDRLPFLLKVLAAAEPLSLQAHPSLRQAQEGYARENDAGIALDAPDRNYRDDNHKPEIIVALTPFRALSGFRPIQHTRILFDTLNIPELDHYSAILDDDLRALFTTWITIPRASREKLIDAIVAASHDHLHRGDWISDILEVVVSLNERYPGDAGVLGALLLNHVHLAPGQALHTDAGQLHAYLEGMGVEIMANSDNVLRGGLTSKYVDVAELVRVLDFAPTVNPRVELGADGAFDAPVDEFRLYPRTLAAGEEFTVDNDGPTIVLCTGGGVTGAGPGGALWIPASAPAQSLAAGPDGAHVFLATV